MIVLDSSIALEIVLNTPLGTHCAGRVFGQLRHAPHLIDLEILNALRRFVRLGRIDEAEAGMALDAFTDIPIERHAHVDSASRIWELRNSVSPYDCAYIALAEVLDATLLTCDGKLSRSHGHNARIELLS